MSSVDKVKTWVLKFWLFYKILSKQFAYFLLKIIVQNGNDKSIFYFPIIAMTWIGYIIIWAYIGITFWAVLMWIDKMARVIIWNYLAWVTAFAFWNLIHQWVLRLSARPTLTFLWISYAKYANFLSAGQLTFVLLLFAWLIRLIYACGRIQVTFSTRATTEKLYFIILIPITVLSFVIWPYIALKSDWIQTLSFIENTIIQTFWLLAPFIRHIPFWMFVNWIVFIIISSHINFKISVTAKATKLPEWM